MRKIKGTGMCATYTLLKNMILSFRIRLMKRELLPIYFPNFCGFTLVELLIVISLLGILSGVMFSVINPKKTRQSSEDRIRITNTQKIKEAANAYFSLEGKYPTTEAEISPYIASWPNGVPNNDDTYEYSYDADEDSFSITSKDSEGINFAYDSKEDKFYDCDSETVACGTPDYTYTPTYSYSPTYTYTGTYTYTTTYSYTGTSTYTAPN